MTEIIFRFGRFDFLGAKNNVFGALGFVGCVISDSRHLWRRKLHKQQNDERQKHYFLHQENQNHPKQKIFSVSSGTFLLIFVFLFSRRIYPRQL